jgi:hypothetical protein
MVAVKTDNDDIGIDYKQNIFSTDKINITIKYGQVFPNKQQAVGW